MKLMICTPCRTGLVQHRFMISVIDLIKALTITGVECAWKVLAYHGYVHLARDRLTMDFMSSGYSDLLFVDDDIGFDPGGVLRMLGRDVDVIGAVCCKRNAEHEPVVRLLQPRRELDGMVECIYIGTGLLRIRRDALAKFASVGIQFFNVHDHRGKAMGEDVWFCNNHRALGGRVWAEQGVHTTHTGPHVWELTWMSAPTT